MLSYLSNSVPIVTINDEDQTLGVLVVVSPQWSDLVLTTDVPHGEVNVLVLHGFDVKSNRWNGGHHLSQLQLVQDRRLTRCVQTDL